MTNPTAAFTQMMPGFDFLQGLVKNAGAAVPGMGQWVTPTLDPAELDKRIEELRTVQFWLEQNARLLSTTIQALEVQRMTLTTLKSMNVSFSDLTESLKIRMPEPGPAAAEPAPTPAPTSAPTSAPTPAPAAEPAPATAAEAAPSAPSAAADPLQWWGALTRQFNEIAANAMKDGGAEAAQQLAGAMVQQGIAAASKTLQAATNPLAAAGQPSPDKPAAGATARPRASGKTSSRGSAKATKAATQAQASSPAKAPAKRTKRPKPA